MLEGKALAHLRLRDCWLSGLPTLLLWLLLLRPPATQGKERRAPLAGRRKEARAPPVDSSGNPTYGASESVLEERGVSRPESGALHLLAGNTWRER